MPACVWVWLWCWVWCACGCFWAKVELQAASLGTATGDMGNTGETGAIGATTGTLDGATTREQGSFFGPVIDDLVMVRA